MMIQVIVLAVLPTLFMCHAVAETDPQFHRSFTDFRPNIPGAVYSDLGPLEKYATYRGGIMVDTTRNLTLHWGFSCNTSGSNGHVGVTGGGAYNSTSSPFSCGQQAFQIRFFDRGTVDQVFDTGMIQSGTQIHIVQNVGKFLKPRSRYTWQVTIWLLGSGGTPHQSGLNEFFTAPSSLSAVPIWAPLNASKSFPIYAVLQQTVTLPADSALQTALLFVTANPPVNKESDGIRPTKILAGYKVWINDVFVGLGPGRPRCEQASLNHCTFGAFEHVYDGYDVSDLIKGLVNDTSNTTGSTMGGNVTISIVGFGIKSQNGDPKVMAQLELTSISGAASNVNPTTSQNSPSVKSIKSLVVSQTIVTDETWKAFDADSVFKPTGNSGCNWYYYPQEMFDASVEQPQDSPIHPLQWQHQPSRAIHYDVGGVQDSVAKRTGTLLQQAGVTAALQWVPAMPTTPFSVPLVPKPSSPVEAVRVSPSLINMTEVGTGQYFVDFGREIQGGVILTIALPSEWLHTAGATGNADVGGAVSVTIRMGEELDNGRIKWPPRTSTNPGIDIRMETKWVTDHVKRGIVQ